MIIKFRLSSRCVQSLQLSVVQKRILRSLVVQTDQHDPPIDSGRIAEDIGRARGTIRNQMMSLSALQLVEGVPGNDGGYRPTDRAYSVLNIDQIDDPEHVSIEQTGEEVTTASVVQIRFSSVGHPDQCRAEVMVRGDVQQFEPGEAVTVGPTPVSQLRLRGTIDAVEMSEAKLIVRTNSMQAPSEESAGQLNMHE